MDENDIMTTTRDNGWLSFVSHLKIYSSPGNHHAMIKEPHVKNIADIINEMLASATVPSANHAELLIDNY